MSAVNRLAARSPRVAMLSVHTSPLAQPGIGDAGGMNVYITELAAALAQQGAQVDIFTRRTSPEQPDVVEVEPGVSVRHVTAGPYEGLKKEDLPGQLSYFARGVLRTAVSESPYDVVHSHYWLSGQVGAIVAEHWGVPLVHSMHTMARVKNAHIAPADKPEPKGRIIGEEQVVAESDALIANTDIEAMELEEFYDADPAAVHVVAPGVDLGAFSPVAPLAVGVGAREHERASRGLGSTEKVIVFAGRVQPLKGPDVLVDALGILARRATSSESVPTLVILGGASGRKHALSELKERVRRQGIEANVRFELPATRPELAAWFRVADVVAMPSRSESFGLVALEAQSCGTPVIASCVGGLKIAVKHNISGLLVRDHRPESWANALGSVLSDPQLRSRLAGEARAVAATFTWENTAKATLEVYESAVHQRALQMNSEEHSSNRTKGPSLGAQTMAG